MRHLEHTNDRRGKRRVVLCAQHDAVGEDETHETRQREAAEEEWVEPLVEALQLYTPTQTHTKYVSRTALSESQASSSKPPAVLHSNPQRRTSARS